MMHGRGKSSPVIVAGKPANKAQPETVTAAESVERRAGAKGNADQPATNRTQGRERVAASGLALALASIRQAAMLDCQYPRWEPYAGKLQVRVCAGGARQLASLPRLRRREFITLIGGATASRPCPSRHVGRGRLPAIGREKLQQDRGEAPRRMALRLADGAPASACALPRPRTTTMRWWTRSPRRSSTCGTGSGSP